ncbi:MAG TPA: family 43 glycosylhydrolase [Mycobacteriales bacterium]
MMGTRRLAALLVAVAALAAAAVQAWPAPVAAATPAPTVTASASPALAQDAPDPDIVRVGSTFYAFTTGTTWGNQIGIAKTTSADPRTQWTTVGSAFPGTPYSGSAGLAPWQRNNTATSPGVFQVGSTWIMFYDAVVATPGAGQGKYCLSVATAAKVTGPYTDSSSGPLVCQASLGGSIDPQPFVDPQTGGAYLLWKSNDGSSAAASQVWSAPLTASGTALAAAPAAIFTIHSATYSWQTTTDDPSMVFAGGQYYLFFSGGDYLSNYYPVGYVLCSNGPRGGCDLNEPSDPILKGYGGTGGGMEFTDASGAWWIAYQTWKPSGCTSYATAGCQRQLFVAPISLPKATPAITTTALPKAPVGSPYDQSLAATGGTAPYTWSITAGTLPAGLSLDASTGAVSGTPSTTGTANVTFEVTDASGLTASAAMPVSVVAPAAYSAITPVRICDTRAGNPSGLSGQAAANCPAGSTVPAGGTRTIAVAGDFRVPTDATAVVLNVTAVAPTGTGYVTAFPAGAARPVASTINVTPGVVVPNLVEVGTGAGGQVSLYASAGTDLVVDLEGYTSPSTSTGEYVPLAAPERICDTRPGNPSSLSGAAAGNCSGPGGAGSTLTAGGTKTIAVAAPDFDIPADATAAVLNVTVANPVATGFLTVFPAGAAQPTASNVNYNAGQVTANRVVVPLSGGDVSIFSHARADVVVDVSGYLTASGGGSAFSAAPAPVRICDTRPANPSQLAGGAAQCTGRTIGAAGTLRVNVRGLAGVPAGATAVVVNLTGVAPTGTTYLTVFPGPTRPFASDLNPAPGEVRANLVVATIASDGTISVFNHAGSTNVIVDVEGWYG